MPGAGVEPAWGCPRGIFLPATAFAAARRSRLAAACAPHLGSGLYLCRAAPPWRTRAPGCMRFRQGPSSLYTFPGRRARGDSARGKYGRSGLSSVLQPPRRAAVPPNLTPFTPGVSRPGCSMVSSPLRLPISPPGQGVRPRIVQNSRRESHRGDTRRYSGKCLNLGEYRVLGGAPFLRSTLSPPS